MTPTAAKGATPSTTTPAMATPSPPRFLVSPLVLALESSSSFYTTGSNLPPSSASRLDESGAVARGGWGDLTGREGGNGGSCLRIKAISPSNSTGRVGAPVAAALGAARAPNSLTPLRCILGAMGVGASCAYGRHSLCMGIRWMHGTSAGEHRKPNICLGERSPSSETIMKVQWCSREHWGWGCMYVCSLGAPGGGGAGH